jgi:hypothetical protein
MDGSGKWLAVVILVAACGAIFTPKRSKPPDVWSLKAAAMHAMVTPPPAYLKGDCSAAPVPDLELFCKKRCGDIGELSLHGYCAWSCDDIKNPDLAVFCKLEVKRANKKQLDQAACADINNTDMRTLCRQWITSLVGS